MWRQAAENVAESLQKGMRVVVQGRLKQRSYETREGEKRTVVELDVEEVGPSLKYATAKVARVQRSGGGGGYGSQPAAAGTTRGPPARRRAPVARAAGSRRQGGTRAAGPGAATRAAAPGGGNQGGRQPGRQGRSDPLGHPRRGGGSSDEPRSDPHRHLQPSHVQH